MAQSKIKARHGVYTGQPSGTTFAAKPHDMTAKNSSEGKKISARTSIVSQSPNGTTFESHKELGINKNWNGEQVRAPAGQTKKPDRFGVECPTGVTSNNASGDIGKFIDTPDASAAPLRGIKTITESTGLYRPAKSGPVNMIGDVPTGKSSPKRGDTDKGDSNGFAKD
jgi:hypothetical protein